MQDDRQSGLLSRLVLLLLIADATYVSSRIMQLMAPVLRSMLWESAKLVGLSEVRWEHDQVSAASNVAIALLTGVLATIAWVQLGVIARQQSQSATLDACNRYDSEVVLQATRRRLERHLKGMKQLDKVDLCLTLNSLFNYFDAIAVGIEQNLYDERIARDHMANVLNAWVKDIDRSDDPEIVEYREGFIEDYQNLTELYRRWYPRAGTWLNRPIS